MDKLIVVTSCDDHACGCLPPRSTVAIIAVISLIACTVDMLAVDTITPCGKMREHLESARHLLETFFQMANMLLLFASIVENPLLVQIYVWYTLAFVVMGLVMALLDFLLRYRNEGAVRSLTVFVPEVAFLFVIFRCLSLVDTYRKHLHGVTIISH